MASTTLIDDTNQDSEAYICPFPKARPGAWLHSKCLVYRNPNLRDTVVRRHVGETHRSLNATLSRDDPRYIDPKIFDEISAYKKDKRLWDDVSVWQFVYRKIKGATVEDAAMQDPRWSPFNLYLTLASVYQYNPSGTHFEIGATSYQQFSEPVPALADIQGNDIAGNILTHQDSQLEFLFDRIRDLVHQRTFKTPNFNHGKGIDDPFLSQNQLPNIRPIRAANTMFLGPTSAKQDFDFNMSEAEGFYGYEYSRDDTAG